MSGIVSPPPPPPGLTSPPPTSNQISYQPVGLATCCRRKGMLRRHESTGRALGDRGFVEQVSAATGRDLVPKKPGRKRKKEK